MPVKQVAKQVATKLSYKDILDKELNDIINNTTGDIIIEMDHYEFTEMKMKEADKYIGSVSSGLLEFVHQYKEMKNILDKQKLNSEKRKAKALEKKNSIKK